MWLVSVVAFSENSRARLGLPSECVVLRLVSAAVRIHCRRADVTLVGSAPFKVQSVSRRVRPFLRLKVYILSLLWYSCWTKAYCKAPLRRQLAVSVRWQEGWSACECQLSLCVQVCFSFCLELLVLIPVLDCSGTVGKEGRKEGRTVKGSDFSVSGY